MTDRATRRVINQTDPNLPIGLTICVIAAGLLAAIVWAAQTRIPEIARAAGQIGPLNDLYRVDHFDGGVVRAVEVNPGDTVAAGQLLAVITQPNLLADLRAAEETVARLEQDRFRLNRVLATLDGAGPAPGPPADAPPHAAVWAYIASQDALYRARRRTIETRVARLRQSAEASRAVKANAEARLALALSQQRQGAALSESGLLSRSDQTARAERAEAMRAEVLEAELALVKAEDAVQEARDSLAEAETVWREDLIARLYETEVELAAATSKAEDLRRHAIRADVRAPRAGTVQSVAADAVGQVVAPGGPVMEILGSDDQLVGIVKLSPRDIGHVTIGAPVKIRPTTFDFRRFGDITGRVVSIAPTSQIDDDNQPFFRTILALDSTTIGTGAGLRHLRAGMEISADIVTSDRTLMAYFLAPAERVLDRSFTER
ncbi:MAG: HlyD family type I secretion periplasmic adaptor subunit [Pseudomonadota bacterium]